MFHQEYFSSEEQAIRERNAKEAEARKVPEEKLEYKVEQEPRKRSFPEKRPQAETISGKKAHRGRTTTAEHSVSVCVIEPLKEKKTQWPIEPLRFAFESFHSHF
jgi:hypothetical protein